MLRFMRVVKVCMAICAVVTVAGCGGGDKPRKVGPRDGGRLVVREVHRERADHLTYIEGAIQFVELTTRGESGPVAKFELDSRKPVARIVEPGDYRVVSYTRSCSGACDPVLLDEPTGRCARTLSIKRGERRTLRVVTVVDRRCTIREEGR
jgi:hypothetical protein